VADIQNIASLIAQVPKVPEIDFSALGNLPNECWEGLKQSREQQLQGLFKDCRLPINSDGSVDYGQASRPDRRAPASSKPRRREAA
jgi:hypothetical protein